MLSIFFFLLLPFKIPFYFIYFTIIIIFAPEEQGKEERKKKLVKQSPNAKHLALSLWIPTVALALTSWGAFLKRKWRRTEPPRSERRALLPPHLSPPSLHLGRVLSLCSLPLPTPTQPVCSKSRFWLERPASTFATPGTLQLQARALRVLTLPLLAAFKFIMPFIACYCMCYSHCPGDWSGSSGRGTRCGFH